MRRWIADAFLTAFSGLYTLWRIIGLTIGAALTITALVLAWTEPQHVAYLVGAVCIGAGTYWWWQDG